VSDDIFQFLGEHRIVADFEVLAAVRLHKLWKNEKWKNVTPKTYRRG
jgi:hypothetical protein